MQQNQKGVRFNDLCRVCDHFFGQARQTGRLRTQRHWRDERGVIHWEKLIQGEGLAGAGPLVFQTGQQVGHQQKQPERNDCKRDGKNDKDRFYGYI